MRTYVLAILALLIPACGERRAPAMPPTTAVAATAAAFTSTRCDGVAATADSITIAAASEPGARLHLSGRVVDALGRSVRDVTMLVYHTDSGGVYGRDGAPDDPPRLCGVLVTGADGRYAIATIRPGNYPTGRTPAHVHFELSGAAIEPLVTEVFFEGDRYLDRAELASHFGADVVAAGRTSLVRPLVDDGLGGYLLERDIVVRRRAGS